MPTQEGDVAGLRVFISHTSEFGKHPPGRSFIAATKRAIERAGDAVVEMDTFPVQPMSGAQASESRVAASDALVVLVGFKYGTPVAGTDPVRSHVELEFDVAVRRGKDLLAFMLDEQTPVPINEFVDHRNWVPQQEFRRRIRSEAGVVGTFSTPTELELLIFHGLITLHERRSLSPQSHLAIEAAQSTRRDTNVDRSGPSAKIMEILLDPNPQTGVVAALHGAGGFGKTTLAAGVSEREEVRARFPQGIHWVTIGRELSGVALASGINDLIERISGERRPTLTDPEQAGRLLGATLRDFRCLLIVDDVWRRSQVRPFLHGAPNCIRLFTTRIESALPASCQTVLIDAMTDTESEQLLTRGIKNAEQLDLLNLIALTGRWPVLLGLVNHALRKLILDGVDPTSATAIVRQRLADSGPTAWDMRRAEERDLAVELTINASLSLLAERDRPRFAELAIFVEDALITYRDIEVLWGESGGLSRIQCEDLCDELLDLSLLIRRDSPFGLAFRLHDIVRTYLRHDLGADGLAIANRAYLAGWERVLKLDAAAPVLGERTIWSHLPRDAAYLWNNLAYHLGEAEASKGRADTARIVEDARFLAKKLEILGSPAVEADLVCSGTEFATELQHAIRRTSHLLSATAPPNSIGSVLAARIPDKGLLKDFRDRLRSVVDLPRFDLVGKVPDSPHPRLTWLLTADSSLSAVDIAPAGDLIATGGQEGLVRLWDRMKGMISSTLEGHTGWIRSVCFGSDGNQLVTAGDDCQVIVWDIRDERSSAAESPIVLCGHTAPVRACVFGTDDRWVLSTGYDGLLIRWNLSSRKPDWSVAAHSGAVRTCSATANGAYAVTAGDDQLAKVWDVATGRVVGTYDEHTASIWGSAIHPNGLDVATVGDDQIVRVWNLLTRETKTSLAGHTAGLNTVEWAPDGRWLASSGDDQTVRIWSWPSGRQVSMLTGHTGIVRRCIASRDSESLVSVDATGSMRLWDTLWEPSGPGGDAAPVSCWIRTCDINRDGTLLVTGGDDGLVRVWNPSTGHVRVTIGAADSVVRTCAISSDGTWVVAGGGDGNLRMWSTKTGALLRRFDSHTGWVRACAVTPDSNLLVSGGDDRVVRVWDTKSGELLHLLAGHTGAIRACAVNSDGSSAATAGDDGTIRIWRLMDGTLINTLRLTGVAVRTCTFLSQGDLIVGAGDGPVIEVWNYSTGELAGTLSGHTSSIRSLAHGQTETYLAACADSGQVYIWDYRSRELVSTVDGHEGPARSCAMAFDGSWFATAGCDGVIRIWNTYTGQLLRGLSGRQQGYSGCTMLEEDSLVAAASGGGSVEFIEPTTGHTTRTLPVSSSRLTFTAAGRSAGQFLVGGVSGVIYVCSSNADEPVRTYSCGDSMVNHAAISPSGNWLVAACGDGRFRVWNLATERYIGAIRAHSGWARRCVFNADGTLLATTGDDGVVRLWDGLAGSLEAELSTRAGTVYCCAFNPVTSSLASGSHDGVLRIWDLRRATVHRELRGHAGGIWWCGYSDDGLLLASAGDDGTVRMWDSDGQAACMMRVSGPIRDCHWLGDGKTLIAAGDSGVHVMKYVS